MKTENELIAEFIGARGKFIDGEFHIDYKQEGMRHFWSVPKYDTSWDWLMPVVEKIELLNKRSIVIEGLTATTSLNVELIPTSLGGYIAKRGESKIKSVYQVCVEFIKWHSQNS